MANSLVLDVKSDIDIEVVWGVIWSMSVERLPNLFVVSVKSLLRNEAVWNLIHSPFMALKLSKDSIIPNCQILYWDYFNKQNYLTQFDVFLTSKTVSAFKIINCLSFRVCCNKQHDSVQEMQKEVQIQEEFPKTF